MTRVDFYILDSDDPVLRMRFACRLAEKAWRMGNRIHIHASDRMTAETLDNLLWETRPEAFIPHALTPATKGTPIHIGYGENGYGKDGGQHHDLLINLCEDIPLFFSRFDRVSEIVTQIPEQLATSRERFKFYRERGYPLESHKISAKGQT